MRERETDAAAKAAAVAKSELLSKDSTVRELETPMWQTLVEQTAPEFDTNYLQLIRAAEAIHDEGLVSNLAGELRSPENRLSQTLCPSHVSDSERCPKIDASDAVAAATLLLGCGRLRCASQILQSIPQENNPEYRGLTPLFAHAGLIPQAKESFSQALAYARFRHDDDAHRDTPDLAGIPIGVADQGQFDAAIEMAMALPETGPRAIALTGILGSALDQGAVESLPRIMEAASADNNASEGSAYFIYRAQAFARLGQFRNARQDVFALPDRAQRLRAVAAIMEERAKQLQPELARRFHAERVLMAPKQEPRQLTNRLYAR
jgi:hypothetical protein